MKKTLFNTLMFALVTAFIFTGCVERNYYHQYHHHSPEYMQRHTNVDINIHN